MAFDSEIQFLEEAEILWVTVGRNFPAAPARPRRRLFLHDEFKNKHMSAVQAINIKPRGVHPALSPLE
jgi:hypothetical protein